MVATRAIDELRRATGEYPIIADTFLVVQTPEGMNLRFVPFFDVSSQGSATDLDECLRLDVMLDIQNGFGRAVRDENVNIVGNRLRNEIELPTLLDVVPIMKSERVGRTKQLQPIPLHGIVDQKLNARIVLRSDHALLNGCRMISRHEHLGCDVNGGVPVEEPSCL